MPGCMPFFAAYSPCPVCPAYRQCGLRPVHRQYSGPGSGPEQAGVVVLATIQLVNAATGVTSATTRDASGKYMLFESCPRPVQSHGRSGWLAKSEANATLLTEQNPQRAPSR